MALHATRAFLSELLGHSAFFRNGASCRRAGATLANALPGRSCQTAGLLQQHAGNCALNYMYFTAMACAA